MFDSILHKKISVLKWLLAFAGIFFLLIGGITAAYISWEKKYVDKIYPGVYLNDLDLGGKTYTEAKVELNNKIDKINKDGLVFYYQKKYIDAPTQISSLDADIVLPIVSFDLPKTLGRALSFGRDQNFFNNLKNKIHAYLYGAPIYTDVSMNQKELAKTLSSDFQDQEEPAKNAEIIYNKAAQNKFYLTEESMGKVIDYNKGMIEMKKNLTEFNNYAVQLFSKTDYPDILKKDCLGLDEKAIAIMNLAPLYLKLAIASSSNEANIKISSSTVEAVPKFNSDGKEWIVDADTLANWITFKNNTDYQAPKNVNDQNNSSSSAKIVIDLKEDKILDFLQNIIAPEVNREPEDAKFKMDNEKIVEYNSSQDGLRLDLETNLAAIKSDLLDKSQSQIKLSANPVRGISASELDGLGITEIIGTGVSDFSGSPVNRRHNIAVGAGSVNGVLIKPGEEFSLVKTLGVIDGRTGYLPELVIKDNKTTPEFGGGLCQVGTTMFRAALATGLPITMRQNHSYRVGYYEPAGTDATIYDPLPDLRFVNDTGSHILVQRRIEGNKLYFDFWGKKDGRAVQEYKPTIYNIVKPPAGKVIETLSLPVGQKKCTEKAHSGADAFFDYKVTHPTGEIKEKRFTSHYVPWQEVCLVGVDKLNATSTAAVVLPNIDNIASSTKN
jgi:vancomycin resistance protein YoaR